MLPIDGPRAKLARAREHVSALKGEFDSWTGMIEHETGFDPERRQLIVRATAVPDLPLRWSTILGDAIHNYRSVLDHLVWQLARVNAAPGGEPPIRVQFPIVSEEQDWAGQLSRVDSLSARHQHLVEGCQPYHRGIWMGAGPPRQPLEDLRDLSNVDKHRFVMVTTYGADMGIELSAEYVRGITLGQYHFLVGLPVAVGTELAMVDVLDLSDDKNYDVSLRYVPSTYFAIAGGVNALKVLEKIDEAVSKIFDFFSTEAPLLHEMHPALQSPEDRELAAMSSLRARLRFVAGALRGINVSPGVVAPNPYRAWRVYLDDLLTLWDE